MRHLDRIKPALLAAVIILGLAGGGAHAQDDRFKQGFEGVISAGLNAAQIDGDGLSGFNMPGAMIGVGAIFHYSPSISFGPEFFFSQKGSRSTQDDLAKYGGNVYVRHRTTYIDIPVLLHYHATPTITLTGGPSFNALVAANVENVRTPKTKIPTFWRPVDVGMVGGFEIRVIGNLHFAGRWFYSLLPAERSDLATFDSYQILIQGAGMRHNHLSALLRLKL